jgi:hypothetical protein
MSRKVSNSCPRMVSHNLTVPSPLAEASLRLSLCQAIDDTQFMWPRSQAFYAETLGRPSLAPGKYFRSLLLGYFEGIDSERGIAWRLSDSFSLRGFVGYAL